MSHEFASSGPNNVGARVTGTSSSTASTVMERGASNETGIGQITADSGIINNGYAYLKQRTRVTSQTIDDTPTYAAVVYYEDATTGARTVTLPPVADGKTVFAKKTDATVNALSLAGASSDLIEGVAVFPLYCPFDSVILHSDGTSWFAFSKPTILFTSIADSSEATGATSGVAYDVSFTLLANTLRAREQIEIDALVRVTGGNSTDTLTLALKIGSTTLMTSNAFDVTNAGGDVARIHGLIQIRTKGASGTYVADGWQGLGVPGTATAMPWFKVSTAIDTTATQAITVVPTWSSSSASNKAILNRLTVKRIGA